MLTIHMWGWVDKKDKTQFLPSWSYYWFNREDRYRNSYRIQDTLSNTAGSLMFCCSDLRKSFSLFFQAIYNVEQSGKVYLCE